MFGGDTEFHSVARAARRRSACGWCYVTTIDAIADLNDDFVTEAMFVWVGRATATDRTWSKEKNRGHRRFVLDCVGICCSHYHTMIERLTRHSPIYNWPLQWLELFWKLNMVQASPFCLYFLISSFIFYLFVFISFVNLVEITVELTEGWQKQEIIYYRLMDRGQRNMTAAHPES